MTDYTAPVRDMRFVLNDLIGMERITALPGYDHASPDLVDAILDEAAKFAGNVLAPLNHSGDKEGARLDAAGAHPPAGFADAYAQFVAGGWNALGCDPDFGGQGLPAVLGTAVKEMWNAANLAFSLCPLLTTGAIEALHLVGTDAQKAMYLPKMVEGSWTGTMNLTEPQAGSDLAAVRTRAVPNADGSYAISGQKIYITYGEHELTDNILHLVLARLPDAPEGSAGISLFAVPKFLPDGSRNGVACLSIEHKLGIHASPTCVMGFEGALGELVGPQHKGLACMFAMMNAARLGVAMQGVAVAERAFRRATDFANGRAQGGAAIIEHPDVRRMLLTMRALALGGRALTLYAANCAEPRASLLIPVAKSWCTDAGVEAASIGVQVHGGMGFVEETGAAQHLRDARITPIYEGTNGIQAITLLRRGLLRDQGAAVTALLDEILDDAPLLASGVATARTAADHLRQAEARTAEAGASAFLQIIGTLTAGWLCAKMVAAEDAPPAARTAAAVFLDQIMPRVAFHAATLNATPALVGRGPIE